MPNGAVTTSSAVYMAILAFPVENFFITPPNFHSLHSLQTIQYSSHFKVHRCYTRRLYTTVESGPLGFRRREQQVLELESHQWKYFKSEMMFEMVYSQNVLP